jgi:hypothetical protein
LDYMQQQNLLPMHMTEQRLCFMGILHVRIFEKEMEETE